MLSPSVSLLIKIYVHTFLHLFPLSIPVFEFRFIYWNGTGGIVVLDAGGRGSCCDGGDVDADDSNDDDDLNDFYD